MLQVIRYALLFLVAICFSSQPTLADEQMDAIVSKYKDSVALIAVAWKEGEKEIPAGSGFFIDQTGWILTCYHVLAQDKFDVDTARIPYSISVVKSPSSVAMASLRAHLVAFDKYLDVALLKVDEGPVAIPTLGDSNEVIPPRAILSIGYKEARILDFKPGHIANKSGAKGRWRIDQTLFEGDSGGPVFDLVTEKVIGIMAEMKRLTPMSSREFYIIPINLANNLVRIAGIPTDRAYIDKQAVGLEQRIDKKISNIRSGSSVNSSMIDQLQQDVTRLQSALAEMNSQIEAFKIGQQRMFNDYLPRLQFRTQLMNHVSKYIYLDRYEDLLRRAEVLASPFATSP